MGTKVNVDDATLLGWLDLEMDNAIEAEADVDREQLIAGLEARPTLREERRQLEQLHGLIAASRIKVREGFTDQVMAGLPTAPWERTTGAWRLPVALLISFGVVGGLLLGTSGTLGGVVGTADAVFDLFQTTLLAGAGLLGATWRGAGFAIGEWLAASKLNVIAFGGAVFFLNLLLIRMVRRRRPKAAVATAERDDGGRG